MHVHLVSGDTNMFATNAVDELVWKAKDAAMVCELYGLDCPPAWREAKSSGSRTSDLAEGYRNSVERFLSLSDGSGKIVLENKGEKLRQLTEEFANWWAQVESVGDLLELKNLCTWGDARTCFTIVFSTFSARLR